MKEFTLPEVSAKVHDVIVDALGVDDDEVIPTASLAKDLGAESIDWLDIIFRLERVFSIDPKQPFKIPQGELFSEVLTNFGVDEKYVDKDGFLTLQGKKLVQQHHPEAGILSLDSKISFFDLRDRLLTVGYIERYIAQRFGLL